MNEILKRLYESLYTESYPDNPFVSAELSIASSKFLDAYCEKSEKAENAYTELHEKNQQHAFEIGFYTAVRLLLQ